MNKKRTMGRLLTALASAGGILAALYLVDAHIAVATTGSAGGALCDLGETVNCDAAALSGWSEVLGIPIAALGLAFYVAAFLATLAFGRRASVTNPVALPALLGTLFLFACAYSVVLAVVSLTQLEAICPVCFLLYGMNLLGLAGTWLWRTAPPWQGFAGQVRHAKELPRARHALVLVGVGAIALAGSMLYIGMEKASHADQQRLLESSRRGAPPVDESALRAEHSPAKGAGVDAPVVIVEFSNYACPWCARLATTFDAVLPEYADQVRLELRPLPRAEMPASMEAARASYCSAAQNGFATMHARLYQEISGLTRQRALALGEEVGLAADAFRECMEGDEVNGFIRADRDAANALGVSGTPTFFVNGVRREGFVEPEDLRRLIRGALRDSAETETETESESP